MPTPSPLFASEATAAKLLDMPRSNFRALVDAGALPRPVTLAPGVERWACARLMCVHLGLVNVNTTNLDFREILEIHEARGKRHNRYVPPKTRAKVFERDGEICAYCGTTEGPFHLDHVHPVSRGGENDEANLAVACVPCNMAKRDKTVEEWRMGTEAQHAATDT
jgi:hypothetical protein